MASMLSVAAAILPLSLVSLVLVPPSRTDRVAASVTARALSGGAESLDSPHARSILEDGDAVCELKMRYEGTLDDPTWVNQDAECAGKCPTSGDCTLQFVSSSGDDDSGTVVTKWECRCPSGGGNGGCRGQEERTSLDGGQTISSRKLLCVGSSSCSDTTTCDWKATTAPPNRAGNWATCKCQ